MTDIPARHTEYTWRQNRAQGRHGWLRLTPAYSLRLVEELLTETDEHLTVLDPFCGTGTTALCAAQRGHEALSIDINPFLVWFARSKTVHYSAHVLNDAHHFARTVVTLAESGTISPTPAPPIHNIDRWWSDPVLNFLRRLHSALMQSTEAGSQVNDLLNVAFCRTLITLSNAAFDHQSMSFKSGDQLHLPIVTSYTDDFLSAVDDVLAGAAQSPSGTAQIIQGDSRKLTHLIARPIDRVITSPPYVNRMSYIRELRPYMYWLGYLHQAREAGELDWQAIGGTWGIATSRLAAWLPESESFQPAVLREALQHIRTVENKSRHVLTQYIMRYFADIWTHLNSLLPVLRQGAEVDYIVGNSSYFGVLLPVEQIYAAMFAELGFREIHIHTVRRRNSSKALLEFRVHARR